MSLLEDIHDEQAESRRGPRCSMCVVMDSLSESDAADLSAALADSSVYATSIARALRRRGVKIKDDAVQRHRSGRCNR